jgi:hypothetical protein
MEQVFLVQRYMLKRTVFKVQVAVQGCCSARCSRVLYDCVATREVQGAVYTLQGTEMQCVSCNIVQDAMSIRLFSGWQAGGGRKPQAALSKPLLYTANNPYSVCKVESAASFHVLVDEEGSSILPLKALKKTA